MSCDWDPASVYRVETRKAAKEHRCDECHGTIRKGENYEYVAGCWDGHWDVFHTCADCIPIRCAIAKLDSECGGWLHGGMQEELENMKWNDAGQQIIAMYNASVAHRGGIRVDAPTEEGAPA